MYFNCTFIYLYMTLSRPSDSVPPPFPPSLGISFDASHPHSTSFIVMCVSIAYYGDEWWRMRTARVRPPPGCESWNVLQCDCPKITTPPPSSPSAFAFGYRARYCSALVAYRHSRLFSKSWTCPYELPFKLLARYNVLVLDVILELKHEIDRLENKQATKRQYLRRVSRQTRNNLSHW